MFKQLQKEKKEHVTHMFICRVCSVEVWALIGRVAVGVIEWFSHVHHSDTQVHTHTVHIEEAQERQACQDVTIPPA